MDGGAFGSIAPLAVVFAIFYFLVIRPQKQEEEEKKKMRDALKNGDQIVTTSGIHGVVVGSSEKTVTLRIAERTNVEFDRSAVAVRTETKKV